MLKTVNARTISRYRIIRRLGAGGMGEVFLAQDTELDRSVAVKVMSAELAKDANQRKRFRAEARAASGLIHPNVCVIHEVGETEDGRPFLAMEYIEGATLDEILRQRRLKMREILRLGIEIAEALDAAHSRGIVHRDIKPGNIMLAQKGNAKVLDFGLAKRFGEDVLDGTGSSAAQTRSGMLVGTPNYMSPEQALGRELDNRSDIFSVGVLLYELVAGNRPFLGKTVGEVINNVVNQEPAPLELENPLFSPALDNIIFKCLEKDPAKRYASARDLATELVQLREQVEQASLASRTLVSTPIPKAAGERQPTKLWQLVQRSRTEGKTPYWVAAGAVALAIAVIAFYPRNHTPTTANSPSSANNAAPARSVAVLPFDNFSGETEMDYLSDGLTEEITTALSRIRGLKVAARNSAFAFKGKKEDIRQIGQALHVNTILEGSVRKSANLLRVTAQLIDVGNGYHIWSETYTNSVEDIFAVQESIARQIAERLQGKEKSPQVQRGSRNPEASNLYLRARHQWNKRTESSLKQAVQLFQQAIDLDPAYADAQAGLAATYYLIPLYSPSARNKDYRPRAAEAARRAMELDPSCAEAYVVLAELKQSDGHAEEAEQYFKKAIQLSPNFATAHHWYGRFLSSQNRGEEALAELRTAADLDPLSPVIQSTLPEYYYLRRDYSRAISEVRPVIDAFPEFVAARRLLIACLLKQEHYEEALKENERVRGLQPENPDAELDMRGFALARSGRVDEARKLIATLERQRGEGKAVENVLMWTYLGLREYDKLMDLMEDAAGKGELDEHFSADPLMDELANLPRFQDLVKKLRVKS
jgi:serine/threonine protein kinase/tetratricopeptide (TPR) repeat protein